MNTVRKLNVKDRKTCNLETNASFIFEVISVVSGWQSSGIQCRVVWEIHTNTSKENVVAIYRGEDVICHKNASLNRNFTAF
jgi:hypothetical protein